VTVKAASVNALAGFNACIDASSLDGAENRLYDEQQ
jgi:hypothetical protein